MKLTLRNLTAKSSFCILSYALLFSTNVFGQDGLQKRTKPIVDEGKRIVRKMNL